jgi:hypothetical protein
MLSSSDRRNKRAASEDLLHFLGHSPTSQRAKRFKSSSKKKKMRKHKFELPKYSSKSSPAKGIQAISEENTRNSLLAEEAPEEEHNDDNDAERSDNMLSVQLPSTGNLNISSSLSHGNESIDENADDEEDEGSWHGSAIPIDFTGAKKPTIFDGTFDESELESAGNEHDDDEGGENTGTKAEADINGRKVYKKLKKLEQAIRIADTAALQQSVVEDLGDIHVRLAALERHHKLSSARANARHDMIFGVLKQISQDINRSNTSQIDGPTVGSPEPPRAASTSTPRANKTADARMAKARQSVEHCLESYMDQMNKSNDVETIKTLGQLCVKYADTLFRSFL